MTRASTRTRLSVLPVFIALIFNLMAPVLSIGAPAGAPGPLSAPEPAIAVSDVDPAHVNFTLEGCNDPSVNLELTDFVCADADYTPGNLGKTWNELDLVPHRLTTSLGTQTAATTTYDVAIAADHMDGGAPGYDVISVPVVNERLSDDSCQIEATGGLVGSVADPGVGGTDLSLYRILTITQDKGTTCVFDYYERLALGSHLFPGASLHSNLLNKDLGTQGIGAKDVSIPVNEIEPQELDKTMSATRGQAYGWTIAKSASPNPLHFANTCLDTEGARSAEVRVTVEWTRSGPTASGETMITTSIYATNPAHRTIQVNVTDRIYEGTGQTSLLHELSSGPVNVPAFSDEVLVLSHQFAYNGNATSFNDVATATYTDLVTGIAVPGQTTATASATTTPSGTGIEHASVLITDTESISGEGLTFSVEEPTIGEFTNYTANASTTGPVNWQFTADDSGSVTFVKTVTVDEPRIVTDGLLTDTATVVGDGDLVLSSDTESVDITADAEVSLTINKTIPTNALRTGESVTFEFEVYAGATATGTPIASPTITFDAGGDTAKSVDVTGLDPGQYTVHEVPKAGWATLEDRGDTITLPDCEGSVVFDNTELVPDLTEDKLADDDTVSAGDPIGFVISVSNGDDIGTGTAKDVALVDNLPGGPGIDWEIAADSLDDGACSIAGALGSEVLTCNFGDLAPGASASVHVVSDTTADSCKLYENTATISASNIDEPLTPFDDTEVLCPDVTVDKEPVESPIDAGDEGQFTLLVSNDGPGVAYDVEVVDTAPAGTVWTVLDPAGFTCDDEIVEGQQVITCTLDELAAGASATILLGYTSSVEDCGTLDNAVAVSAGNEPDASVNEENSDTASIIVECPGLNLIKRQVDENGDPTTDPILAGEIAYFEILVWNSDDEGIGTAHDVVVTEGAEDLPDGVSWSIDAPDGVSCASSVGSDQPQSFSCDLGDLEPGDSVSIIVSGLTDRADCGALVNTARVDATNNDDEVPAAVATIVVSCPEISIEKENDAVGSVLPGTTVGYTLTLSVNDEGLENGEATDVTVIDEMPVGLESPTNISDGGTFDAATRTITWELGNLGEGTYELTYDATVADDVENGEALVNAAAATSTNSQCPDIEELGPECTDDSTVIVRSPSLVIDKVADAEVITISGSAGALVADPAIVTWTLSYTLANGPVTNAVITDEIPTGFVFLDASDGGLLVDGEVTWTFATLSESGSVTFRTTVDPETISRVAPTVNVAVIDSDETEPDEGQDSVTVEVEAPVLGGNPTPKPKPVLPDTATGFGINGEPISVPVELLVAFFIGSLGAATLANVKARSRRR